MPPTGELNNEKQVDTSLKSETVSELVHRHMKDRTHKTTDEELKNATLDLGEDGSVDDESLFEIDNAPVTNAADDDTNNHDDVEKNSSNIVSPLPNPYKILK